MEAASASSTTILKNVRDRRGRRPPASSAPGCVVTILYEGDDEDEAERYLDRPHRGAPRRARRHLARLAARRGPARRHGRRRGSSTRRRRARCGVQIVAVDGGLRPIGADDRRAGCASVLRCLPAARSSCPAGAPRSCARCPVRPARPSSCCCTAGRRRPTSTGSRSLRAARPRASASSPSTTGATAAASGPGAPVPARGLRRRRRRAGRRARHRPASWWPATRWAGPIAQLVWQRHPDRRATASCCAPPPATSPRRPPRSGCGSSSLNGLAVASRLGPGARRAAGSPTSSCSIAAASTSRGPSTQVRGHDWTAVLEAGREHRALLVARRGSPRSTCRPRWSSPTRDHVVPPRRQVRLAEVDPGRQGLPRRRRPRRLRHDGVERSCRPWSPPPPGSPSAIALARAPTPSPPDRPFSRA